MTKSNDLILKKLRERQLNLDDKDILFIRNLYPFLSSDEYENIPFIEEIIEQIQITPKNDEVIEN